MSQTASLPRPAALVILVALLGCAAAAWAITAAQSVQMGMGGVEMMGAGLFLVTWIVMMVAMMFPSAVPFTLAYAAVTRSRDGYLPTAVFVLGYLLVWAAAGFIPLAILRASGAVWMSPPSWLPRLAAAVIVVAGVYQFTPLKDVCLRACRSPLGFLLTHDFGGGARSAIRAGMSHGVYCLGCCWALMAVLAVLGLMNLAWMAVIAAAFFVEKNVRFGDVLPKVVGVACIAGGLVALLV